MTYIEKIKNAAEFIKAELGTAEIGIVLGSGLGDFVTSLEDSRYLDYNKIPGFPVSTVQGHAGRFWVGTLHGKRVFMMQGRFHGYEGYDLKDVTMYVRVMKLLGVESLIVTNAAGCVNLDWKSGDLMIISDYINFSGKNPLTGENLDEFGPRFPSMSSVYDSKLRELCHSEAEKLGITIREGVYMWMNGPCYETPAEIRMVRVLGADAVGMSTVPESIVAVHSGMRVLGISCLTNMAAGILDQPLSHKEVMETADRVKADFTKLLDGIVANM